MHTQRKNRGKARGEVVWSEGSKVGRHVRHGDSECLMNSGTLCVDASMCESVSILVSRAVGVFKSVSYLSTKLTPQYECVHVTKRS